MYRACQQDDGNFVVYDNKNNVLWANQKFGTPNSRMCMQKDGNLVGYNDKGAYWASDTNIGDRGAPYHTIMQNDGNLVIYDKNTVPVWGSSTGLQKTKPTNCNNMKNDPQYKYIIDAYERNREFTDGERNTAIVIVSKLYYPLNNKKQNILQFLNDEVLYNLLKKTVCNLISKDRNYNEVINTFYTEWSKSKRNKAIDILKTNMSAGIHPYHLTNGELYYILLGDSTTTNTYPVITDTCITGQPCPAYLESADGNSHLFLNKADGSYTIQSKGSDAYHIFWPADSRNRSPPYYSQIDETDNNLKVYNSNGIKIHGTDISGLDNPNIVKVQNNGIALLRDPKNNYNIWRACGRDNNGDGHSGMPKYYLDKNQYVAICPHDDVQYSLGLGTPDDTRDHPVIKRNTYKI